jgi:hypothetical protein
MKDVLLDGQTTRTRRRKGARARDEVLGGLAYSRLACDRQHSEQTRPDRQSSASGCCLPRSPPVLSHHTVLLIVPLVV